MRPFDRLTLRTQRLLLRPLWPEDADALFAIFSDPGVMRYWNTPPWGSREEAERSIADDLEAMPSGRHLRLGLQPADAGPIVGTCILHAFHEPSRRAELGYGLAPSSQGRGYTTEALAALLAYGFGELGLNRVEADIDPGNEASARTLARLGFARKGYFRERWIVAGQVSHPAMYGLLRATWGTLDDGAAWLERMNGLAACGGAQQLMARDA